ncbi:MAG: GNAT family N-acetyltransferase [Bacteroidota bacterium]|nr:GNAT family N-acetyltransferase [Bacteroidota bacterium]
MKIRPALNTDIPKLVEFQIAMAKETEDLALDEKTLKHGINAVLNDKQKARYFVAVDGKTLIGCFMVTPEWSDWRAGYFIWLQSVYVCADYRRKGVFRMMYDYLKEIVQDNQDYRGLRLYVERENQNAINAYLKMGMLDSDYQMLEWVKE